MPADLLTQIATRRTRTLAGPEAGTRQVPQRFQRVDLLVLRNPPWARPRDGRTRAANSSQGSCSAWRLSAGMWRPPGSVYVVGSVVAGCKVGLTRKPVDQLGDRPQPARLRHPADHGQPQRRLRQHRARVDSGCRAERAAGPRGVAAVDDRVFERSLVAGIIHGRRAAAVSPSAVSETWLSPYVARPSPTRW
jgi:hypothetical protein